MVYSVLITVEEVAEDLNKGMLNGCWADGVERFRSIRVRARDVMGVMGRGGFVLWTTSHAEQPLTTPRV